MSAPLSRRRTIGFLSSWHVYEDTTIDPIQHALLEGMCAAARDQGHHGQGRSEDRAGRSWGRNRHVNPVAA